MIFQPELEQMQRSQLAELQLERLQRAVRLAYERVPFYREQFDQAGVRPEHLKSLDDLRRLPFTRKQHLREHYPFGLFAVPVSQCVRLHASSGTMGKPTVVGYTVHDIDVFAAVNARAIGCAGGKPGDMLHNAYGYGLFTGGLGLHYGAERLRATVVPVSGGFTQRQIMLLQDFRPAGLSCTPSYALNLADAMQEQGIDPKSLGLRYGIFGAEPWTEEMRQQLEARLGLDAVDIYGLSEVIGPGVACECREAKSGLHINEDHFLPEIVHPETGAGLPYGEVGELVFTSLTKEAFPIIRYRTGDICSLHAEPCACGRTLVRMSRIKGRADDMLIIRGVNLFPSEVEAVLLGMPELAPHYQLVVDRRRALDELTVCLEVTDSVVQQWQGLRADDARHAAEQLVRRVGDRLKALLDLTATVKLMEHKAIPRSEGKAVRVVDHRPKG